MSGAAVAVWRREGTSPDAARSVQRLCREKPSLTKTLRKLSTGLDSQRQLDSGCLHSQRARTCGTLPEKRAVEILFADVNTCFALPACEAIEAAKPVYCKGCIARRELLHLQDDLLDIRPQATLLYGFVGGPGLGRLFSRLEYLL